MPYIFSFCGSPYIFKFNLYHSSVHSKMHGQIARPCAGFFIKDLTFYDLQIADCPAVSFRFVYLHRNLNIRGNF